MPVHFSLKIVLTRLNLALQDSVKHCNTGAWSNPSNVFEFVIVRTLPALNSRVKSLEAPTVPSFCAHSSNPRAQSRAEEVLSISCGVSDLSGYDIQRLPNHIL